VTIQINERNGVARGTDTAPTLDQEKGSAHDQQDSSVSFGLEGIQEEVANVTPADFDTMLDSDGKARSLEQCLSLPIQSAAWSIVSPEVEGADPAIAEEIHHMLTQPANMEGLRTPMSLVIAQMTSAFVYRKAYFEKVFTTIGDRTGYGKLAFRPANSCKLHRDPKTHAFAGFEQEVFGATEPVVIEPKYAMVYVHGQHRKPLQGMSEFEIAYRCYSLKKKIKWLWFSFLEGAALPRTVVYGKDETSIGKAARAIASLRSAGVVGIPGNWVDKLDTIDTKGGGSAEYQAAVRYLDSEAAGSVLAGFTDLPQQGGEGSYALSKDQTDFFLQSCVARSKALANCLTDFAVADLVKWNWGPGTPVPRFHIGPLNPDDITAQLDLLKQLALTPDTVLPYEFIVELTMQVAKNLGMNIDKLQVAIARKAEELAANASAETVEMETNVGAAVDTVTAAAQQTVVA